MAARALAEKNRGVALLVAVIFTSVMLAFGVLIGSLGYKQTVLTQSVKESQHAFYAADTGMECILYADQAMNSGRGIFTNPDGTPVSAQTNIDMFCDGQTKRMFSVDSATGPVSSVRFDLAGGTRCVDLTIYKPTGGIGKTWIFSQGYSVDCATVQDPPAGKRFSSRGMRAQY